jgi:hypothetical protein
MKMLKLIAIAGIGILTAIPAFAIDVSSVQCGLKVVYQGDLDDTVLSKCGTPTYKQTGRWIYDDGYSDYYVVFHYGGGGAFRQRVIRMEIVNRRAP